MKHLFYFVLFQLFFIQPIGAQNDAKAPAVKYSNFGNMQFQTIKTEPAPLPQNWAEGTVSGSIRDKDGAPKVNVIVRCGGKQEKTDDNGDYRITGLRAGVHRISTHIPIKGGDPGPSDGLGGGGADNTLILPESPEVEINAANQNVVQNFVWEK